MSPEVRDRRSGRGEIAAESVLEFLKENQPQSPEEQDVQAHLAELEHFLNDAGGLFDTEQLEDAMQTVMDTYAGGIGTNYRFHEKDWILLMIRLHG